MNEYGYGNGYDDYYEDTFLDQLIFKRVKNHQDYAMEKLGYRFITNFTPEREELYCKAAELHGIKIKIGEAFDGYGKKINYSGYQSLNVSSSVKDLSDFWNTVDEMRN